MSLLELPSELIIKILDNLGFRDLVHIQEVRFSYFTVARVPACFYLLANIYRSANSSIVL